MEDWNGMKYIKTFDLGLDAGIKEFKEEIHQKAYLKYLEEVKNNGWNLKDVPEEFITKELCELAVVSSSSALLFVPEDLKTFEMCDIALENLYDYFSQMEFLSKNLVPEEFKEELAEKYDIELIEKTDERGR